MRKSMSRVRIHIQLYGLYDGTSCCVLENTLKVLTKFDTIDDKVGAAVSMVHKTGQPIVFVGTGQKYTHLRRLNVRTVIKCLFR